jgi:hypothetical protein
MDEETENLEALRQIIPKEMRAERKFNDESVDGNGRFWLAEIDKGMLLVLFGERG